MSHEAVEESLPEVVVCLGTDHHPFDRLVRWVETLADEGWARWFVQHGHTAPPQLAPGVESARLLGLADLQHRMEAAGAVVTHGGPGLIVDAHLAGHRPVVVARNPQHGEHVDGHQMRFVARVSDQGTVVAVQDLASFRDAVQVALASPRAQVGTATPSPAVARFEEFVEQLMRR